MLETVISLSELLLLMSLGVIAVYCLIPLFVVVGAVILPLAIIIAFISVICFVVCFIIGYIQMGPDVIPLICTNISH